MWKTKTFENLTALELWKIYQLRVAVFVVEQNCPYQEVDEMDQSAVHFWLEMEGEIQAYCRIIHASDYIKIGRVIVAKSARGTGLGYELMKNAMEMARKTANKPLYVQAQAHLQKFYQSLGFQPNSQIYLEDGIPHLDMVCQ